MSTRPGLWLGAYRVLSPVLAGLARSVAPIFPKWGRGQAGRRGLEHRLRTAAPGLQGCLWFHASSVGEYEQARPIIAALRAAGHGPLAVTHFSPSGLEYARRNPCADVHDYLPLDTPGAMARLVAAWRPRGLVCVKYDGWPNQVLAAEAAGVPVVLASGSLPPDSGRLNPIARRLFRDVYNRFSVLGVGSDADRRRFATTMGVHTRIVVTGDTRAEQVRHRFEASAGGPVATALCARGRRRLVLGSTWPPDEALWLPVLPDLLRDRPDLSVVIVPHEPTPARLSSLRRDLQTRGLTVATLSDLEAGNAGEARCLLVDRVGVLAEIYRAGTLAYVGGSFTTGVHSTLEPAVASLPVLFGPRIHNAEEALAMVAGGGGFVITTSAEARDLSAILLDDEAAARTAGAKAADVVAEGYGATARSVVLILEAMNAQR